MVPEAQTSSTFSADSLISDLFLELDLLPARAIRKGAIPRPGVHLEEYGHIVTMRSHLPPKVQGIEQYTCRGWPILP